jgi:hypothetical protein
VAAVSDHPLLGSGWQAIKKVVPAGYAPVIAGLLQQNRHKADMLVALGDVRFRGTSVDSCEKRRDRSRLEHVPSGLNREDSPGAVYEGFYRH